MERQPGLETASLNRHDGADLTQKGLALLGRLPALRSVTLLDVRGVSDWLLEQLSKAPLAELTLGSYMLRRFWGSITAEGLLRLTRSRPALRSATLWDENDPEATKRTLDPRSELEKPELIRIVEDLRKREYSSMRCRLGGPPADKL